MDAIKVTVRLSNYRTIPGYPPCYSISAEGKVYSTKSNRHLTPHVNSGGYMQINFIVDGKRKTARLHRLMALAFLPNPDDLPCVNHLDGNKLNNCLANLEWCSYSRNIKHAYENGLNKASDQRGEKHSQARLKEDDVKKIRWLYNYTTLTQLQIAEYFDISREHCRDIINFKKWRYV